MLYNADAVHSSMSPKKRDKEAMFRIEYLVLLHIVQYKLNSTKNKLFVLCNNKSIILIQILCTTKLLIF